VSSDPKRIVVAGYDEIANVYLERLGVSTVRQKWVGRLIDGLPAGGGRVLDLGCVAGIRVARDLDALGSGLNQVHQMMRAASMTAAAKLAASLS
jgi:hypothetical protein